MSDIILNLKQILVSDSPGFRYSKAKYPEIDHSLFLWFCHMHLQTCISDAMLKAQAEIFGSPEYYVNYFYSDGWLAKFKLRYRISF